MALDREITVYLQQPGYRDQHGEYVVGTRSTLPMWAERVDLEYADTPLPGGRRDTIRRQYRVRWVHELAFASPSRVTVSDGTSDHSSLTPILIELGVDGITEVTGKFGKQRRRFLNLDLIWSN